MIWKVNVLFLDGEVEGDVFVLVDGDNLGEAEGAALDYLSARQPWDEVQNIISETMEASEVERMLNSHAALVAALKRYADYWGSLQKIDEDDAAMLAQARAAITQAEAGRKP